MSLLEQVRRLVEEGYAEAITAQEVVSKKNFMKVLVFLESNLNKEEHMLNIELEVRPSRKNKRITNRDDVNTIAFFLSKFEHQEIFSSQSYNQSQVIAKAAEILGVNKYSLKNLRDAFDSFTGSRREGWKKPLDPIQQKILDSLSSKTREDVLSLVRRILSNSLTQEAGPAK